MARSSWRRCPTWMMARSRWRDAAEEVGDKLDGVLRGGEADALRRRGEAGEQVAGRETVFAADECVEPLKREREVRAAFVVGDGVDLVDDDGADAREICAGFLRGEQDVERLRRGDEDVRRLRAWRARSAGSVSPVRTAVRIGGQR